MAYNTTYCVDNRSQRYFQAPWKVTRRYVPHDGRNGVAAKLALSGQFDGNAQAWSESGLQTVLVRSARFAFGRPTREIGLAGVNEGLDRRRSLSYPPCCSCLIPSILQGPWTIIPMNVATGAIGSQWLDLTVDQDGRDGCAPVPGCVHNWP